MNKQFIQDAIRTESRIAAIDNINPRYLHSALVLAVATAEILDAFKKAIFYKRPFDYAKFYTHLHGVQMAQMNLMHGLVTADLDGDGAVVEALDGSAGLDVNAVDTRVLHAIIGKFTEGGEMIEALVKAMTGAELDIINLGEEMGDDKWYDAIFFDATGLDPQQIMDALIAKLKKRYGDKFSDDAANNRDLAGERAVLEEGIAGEQKAA